MPAATLDDQLDLFTVADVAAIQPRPPRLEDQPMRALNPAAGATGWDRHRQFGAWTRTHGRFGSVFRCHGWVLCATSGPIPADPDDWPEHGLREFTRHLGCDHPRRKIAHDDRPGWTTVPACYCVGGDLHMVACACGWESAPERGYQGGLPAALDHLWPGWRDLPVLTSSYPAGERKAEAAWVARAVDAGYDRAWLEGGGPVLTARTGIGTRHVAGRTPGKGYDVACVDGKVVER